MVLNKETKQKLRFTSFVLESFYFHNWKNASRVVYAKSLTTGKNYPEIIKIKIQPEFFSFDEFALLKAWKISQRIK